MRCIVRGIYEQNVRVDNWTAKWAIIASNVNSVHVDDWTAKWAIIASNVNSAHADDWTAEWAIIASNRTKKSLLAIIGK